MPGIDEKIGSAANGEKTVLDGTEQLPINGSQYALVSSIKTYAKTIYDTLYAAFNHTHADSDTGGVVNHTALTNAGTSQHVPAYSSDSTTFLNGMGEWAIPPGAGGGVTLSSDSTQYYNGIGEFAVVTDALLAFTDITTNNVSTSNHGFTPKLPADSTEFLNGQGEWTTPAGGLPAYSSDSTTYLNGIGEWATPAGGSGAFPLYIPIPIYITNNNFASVNDTGATPPFYTSTTNGNQNNLGKWNMDLTTGTYTWRLLHIVGTNRGIYHLLLDGSDVATIDGYAGSALLTRTEVTGISVTGGTVEVQIKMATKNASSSSYFGLMFEMYLIRTA